MRDSGVSGRLIDRISRRGDELSALIPAIVAQLHQDGDTVLALETTDRLVPFDSAALLGATVNRLERAAPAAVRAAGLRPARSPAFEHRQHWWLARGWHPLDNRIVVRACDSSTTRTAHGRHPNSGTPSTVEVPTTCVDCGKPHARSSANWSPTAADRSPHVPRRHAARHNHRGSRHRPGYDQIQPPTAASNDQIQAGDLSAAPQSRAWTADNTGLPRQQRSCRYSVVPVIDANNVTRPQVTGLDVLDRHVPTVGGQDAERLQHD